METNRAAQTVRPEGRQKGRAHHLAPEETRISKQNVIKQTRLKLNMTNFT